MVEEKISLILTLFFKIKSNLCDLKKLCSDPRNDVQIIIMIWTSFHEFEHNFFKSHKFYLILKNNVKIKKWRSLIKDRNFFFNRIAKKHFFKSKKPFFGYFYLLIFTHDFRVPFD